MSTGLLLSRILPRNLWDARVRKYSYGLPVYPVTEVYIHHGATATGMVLTDNDGDGAPDAEEAVWRSYQRYHMGTRGWSDIAYNFGVGKSGQIYAGRGWQLQGGATGSKKDRHSLSICAIGNFDKSQPTIVMIKAIAGWILTGIEKGHISPNVKIYGHRDAYGTTCPGRYLYTAINKVRSIVDTGRINTTEETMDTPIAEWYRHIKDAPDGTKDEAVRVWQVALSRWGLLVLDDVDGVKGPDTRSAHKAFEVEVYGLEKANDKPGRYSWLALLEGPTPGVVEIQTEVIKEVVPSSVIEAVNAAHTSVSAAKFIIGGS